MAVSIREDDLGGPEIARLLEAHFDRMTRETPPESVHALDVTALRSPEITFWTAWDGPELLGCGALRELDARHGEIKSMHTAEAHRGKGVAARILAYLQEEARRRGYARLSLETSVFPSFAPARALYTRFGFVSCGPFGDYRDDPNGMFMTLEVRRR